MQSAALQSAGLWRDTSAFPQMVQALASKRATLQRAAAEGLGRLGDARAVPTLLSMAALPLDRIGEHAVMYALIEIGDTSSTAAGLKDPSPRTRRAALIALDQIPGGGLTPETVVALLTGPDRLLEETAWWIAGRHPEWGGALSRFFEARLSTAQSKDSSQVLVDKLAQLGPNAAIQELLAKTVEQHSLKEARLTALGAMAKTRVKELPPLWTPVVARALGDADLDIVRMAVGVARSAPPSKETAPGLRDALLRLVRDAEEAPRHPSRRARGRRRRPHDRRAGALQSPATRPRPVAARFGPRHCRGRDRESPTRSQSAVDARWALEGQRTALELPTVARGVRPRQRRGPRARDARRARAVEGPFERPSRRVAPPPRQIHRPRNGRGASAF